MGHNFLLLLLFCFRVTTIKNRFFLFLSMFHQVTNFSTFLLSSLFYFTTFYFELIESIVNFIFMAITEVYGRIYYMCYCRVSDESHRYLIKIDFSQFYLNYWDSLKINFELKPLKSPMQRPKCLWKAGISILSLRNCSKFISRRIEKKIQKFASRNFCTIP